MFGTLIESKAPRQRRGAGATVSLVLHGVLVAAAVWATSTAGMDRTSVLVEEVTYVAEARREEPKLVVPAPDVSVATPPKGFQVLVPPIAVPDVIPDVDPTKRPIDEDDFSGTGVAGGRATGVGSGPPVDADQPFLVFQVEKPAMAAPGSASPRYPDILRSAGIEGEAQVQFVVDTSGRADMGTCKVLKASHELFAVAVRNALPEMRFIPAEVGGRRVPQLVQQQFSFTIAR